MGIKPSMTFSLIKGLKACYLQGTSYGELYLHIRPIRPVFLAEFETARNERERLYLEDGQAHRQCCCFILLVCFATGDPSLQNFGVSVLLFRKQLQ